MVVGTKAMSLYLHLLDGDEVDQTRDHLAHLLLAQIDLLQVQAVDWGRSVGPTQKGEFTDAARRVPVSGRVLLYARDLAHPDVQTDDIGDSRTGSSGS